VSGFEGLTIVLAYGSGGPTSAGIVQHCATVCHCDRFPGRSECEWKTAALRFTTEGDEIYRRRGLTEGISRSAKSFRTSSKRPAEFHGEDPKRAEVVCRGLRVNRTPAKGEAVSARKRIHARGTRARDRRPGRQRDGLEERIWA
jgi:hypothetical protein